MKPLMVAEYGLTFDMVEFRAWLASHAPDAVVGYAWTEHACPVASWLHARYGETFYVSWESRIGLVSESAPYAFVAPAWVGEFAYLVDRANNFLEGGSVPVTASCALWVFDQLYAAL